MDIIEENRSKISELCSKHSVSRLFVFGSVLTKKFSNNSDIDFVVNFNDINPYDYADNYFNLKSALEMVFKRPVDLLEEKAIKNPFLKKPIDSTKKIVYGH